MSELTITDLTDILRECAGVDESVNLHGNILDTEFGDLGYDSIALMETAGRIRIDYGVALDDDVMAEADTPRELLRLVNASLTASAR